MGYVDRDWGGVEEAWGDAEVVRDKAAAAHLSIPCSVVPSLRWWVSLFLVLLSEFRGVIGFTTITSTAILFGKTTLHMDASSLVLIGAITPASGILGSLVFPMLQRRCGWSNLHVLVLLVVLVSCIPAYGCLGFVPFVRRLKVGGLTTPGEMFGLAVYFGMWCVGERGRC